MAYTDKNLEFFAAGCNYRDLNREKYKFINNAAQNRYKAKIEHDPEKRKKFLKKAKEFQDKADAITTITPKSLGMERVPKSYFKY